MNSKVVKFVAGAGKTTYSKNYMDINKNGLYLAFNTSVVEELESKGYLAKTIDSLFHNFIIPKFTSMIPIISTGAQIKFYNIEEKGSYLNGAANISIDKDGNIYNKTKKITEVTMYTKNSDLNKMSYFPNSAFVRKIFADGALNIGNSHREDISNFIIENFPDKLMDILKVRFSFIIIDEAQDLKGFREVFAQLLYKSGINLVLLGDDNQNINGGGNFFENLLATKTEAISFRCPEKNCEWIRGNLGIDIYGNDNLGGYKKIKFSEIIPLDDGKRVLLYSQKTNKTAEIIEKWTGDKYTIKKAKGSTINNDVVIMGMSLNKKNLYTAVTRTTRFVYSTINKVNE